MKKVIFILAATLSLVACTSKNESKISGAGATFPAPFYNIVFKQYGQASGNNVTYGAVGSGGGIRSLKDQTVDFGATDVFLSDDELKDMGAEVLHVPTALGAVVLSYNLPNVKGLKLTADVISDIYLGKIKKWNDAKIIALNEGLTLPDKTITVVYRSDGSGTTYVFSDYMSKANEAWKATLGAGKSLKFPVGVAAKGNPGVAGIVAETEGSIGYIGSEYALALNIPSALLQNSAGNFIDANEKSISAAANVDLPDDTRLMITNSSAVDAYPISTFTWIIFYKEQAYNKRSDVTAKSLVSLLKYVVGEEGQAIAAKTHYAPLSESAKAKINKIIESVTYNNVPLSN